MCVNKDQEINIVNSFTDLSIVMPVYNAIDTIIRSINSFLELSESLLKDHGINSSLYIVDDFSTDGSTQLMDDLTQSHNNIFFIKNESNLGPGLSRNKALELIEGGYVGFLDADDEIIYPEYVDSYVKGVRSGADWITFNGWFCSVGAKSGKYDFDRLTDDTEQLSIKCRRGELDGSVIFTIYSLQLLQENHLIFPGGYYEDIPFAYNAMLLAQNRYISNNFSYKKHNVSTSIVNTISERHISGIIDSWLRIDSILEDYNSLNSEIDRMYGIYGYIADLITSVILSDHSTQYKTELFSFLLYKIETDLEITSGYNIETKKDKLTEYFLEKFPQGKSMFVSNINFFYKNLWNHHA